MRFFNSARRSATFKSSKDEAGFFGLGVVDVGICGGCAMVLDALDTLDSADRGVVVELELTGDISPLWCGSELIVGSWLPFCSSNCHSKNICCCWSRIL